MLTGTQTKAKPITADRVVSTTCPYCGVGCTLQLHVKDDFIYRVTSPFDSPVNHGNLCVKGRFGYDFIYHPKRVTVPLVRKYLLDGKSLTGPRDSDFVDHGNAYTPGSPAPEAPSPWDWIETDWDTALNLVADKLLGDLPARWLRCDGRLRLRQSHQRR